ncbi:MAG: conjugal transfer protein TraL, partial [Sneathiella sp.]
QGKGGVGKSFVASLLQQHFLASGAAVRGIDTDPVNATFASYKAFNATHLQIMKDNEFVPTEFDTLSEWILEAEQDSVFVIDNGAATFVPLCAYLVENDLISFLKEQDIQVTLHTVLTGGQALDDTIDGLKSLFDHFPETQICVWINEYFGRPEKNGKSFEESKLYKDNIDHIHGLIRIRKATEGTFGKDLEQMLNNKLTFDEAIASPDFRVMAKQRLKTTWRDLNSQISALQF